MFAKAIARYIRISPRKTRLVADLIRGKSVDEARAVLMNLAKKATVYVGEVLNSAVANATRNPDVEPKDLFVSRITIDGGPMLKRYRAGSLGRAMTIRHRTSHILVELDLKKEARQRMAQAAAEPKTFKNKAKKILKKKKPAKKGA
ncbi:MAG: 50S ribosomal protein L22 [Candidatus Omnitrophota bacterium]